MEVLIALLASFGTFFVLAHTLPKARHERSIKIPARDNIIYVDFKLKRKVS